MNFDTNNGEKILKKLSKDERLMNNNNLFFKTGNFIIKTF